LFINGTQASDVTCAMYARVTSGVAGTDCSKSGIKHLGNGATVTVRFKPDTTGVDPKNNRQSLKIEYVAAG